MKPVSRWSKAKSLKPLDQQISSFFVTTPSSAVTHDTVQETRGAFAFDRPGDIVAMLKGARVHR